MQLRVDADELAQALAVLKTVIKSPRIADTPVLGCVHIWGHDHTLHLTANNLITEVTVQVDVAVPVEQTSGCVDFATLARFARGASGHAITMVTVSPTVLMLSADHSPSRPPTMVEHTAVLSIEEFPRLHSLVESFSCGGVSIADLAMVLEQVTIGGHTTHPSAINEVCVYRPAGQTRMTFAYGDSGRVVVDAVDMDSPGTMRGDVSFALDGCSVPPLIAFLKAAPAARCTLRVAQFMLLIEVAGYGQVLCQLRQTEALAGFPVCAPTRPVGLCDPEADDVLRVVKMLMGTDQREYVRLRGTAGESPLRLSARGGERYATIPASICQSFDVCVRAYALTDMAKLAHEGRLLLHGNPQGPLFIGLEDEPYFTYAITDTEWGNRE